eukprot:272717_1
MIPPYIITVALYLVLLSPIINECTQYDCYDENDCSKTHLTCANNQQCIVNCNGHRSCIASTIQCPSHATCIINCVATNSDSNSICKELWINATLSTCLNVYGSSNFNTLRSAVVYCPLKGKCNLNGYGNHIMAHMDIYALQGFRDLTIDCEHCHLRKLYCTEYFDHSCNIDAQNNLCKLPCVHYNGTDQTCNNYKYYDDDFETIPSESEEIPQTDTTTYKPSNTPSLQPSQFPSFQPSQFPSFQPSQFPSFQPSNNPSQYPSFQPSQYPYNIHYNIHPQYPLQYPSQYPLQYPSQYPLQYPSQYPLQYSSFQPSNN